MKVPIRPSILNPQWMWEELSKVINYNSELRVVDITSDLVPTAPIMEPGELVWFKCIAGKFLVYYDYTVVNGTRVGGDKHYFAASALNLFPEPVL